MIGVIPLAQARQLAEQAGLDLVEISPNADPPVCRIMDYGRYKYEQEKRERAARRSHAATKVKEIKFHANVDEHDYQTKVRHLREFIADGHRVKVSLFFRGRENVHQELGFEILNRVLRDCSDVVSPDQVPTKVGRALVMILAPKRGAKAAAHRPPAASATAPNAPRPSAPAHGAGSPAPAARPPATVPAAKPPSPAAASPAGVSAGSGPGGSPAGVNS